MFTEDQKIGYIVEANKRALASNGASDVTQELVKMAQAANMPLDQAEQMMGYKPGVLTGNAGSNLGMGTQPSTVTPLNLGDRDNWRKSFDSQAAATGRTAGDVMYDYAKQHNLSNADVDKYMGYAPGTADAWVAQNKPGGSGGGGAAGGGPVAGGQMPGGGAIGGGQMPGGAQGGGQNLGMGMNPYLRGMGIDIGNQAADVWNRQILPGTRSSAIAAGGFGGSRQGVVESNALNDLGRNYISGMTNLYGNDYTGQQNRNLQRYGMDQGYDLGLGGLALQNKGLNNSYDLGLRNNDLGFSNLDANINQNNFNNNLASANFGLGVQNYLQNNNQAGITAGTNMQNTAAEYQKYLNSAGNAAGNAGGTRIGTTVS
jgi:hypothetical protein